ncbi:MAG: hypothetical protein LBL74_06770 [Bacteroidales bacterium]|jgi:hypothetical protein|nr:hypothetical protein [Bacteroidales bacterium]
METHKNRSIRDIIGGKTINKRRKFALKHPIWYVILSSSMMALLLFLLRDASFSFNTIIEDYVIGIFTSLVVLFNLRKSSLVNRKDYSANN